MPSAMRSAAFFFTQISAANCTFWMIRATEKKQQQQQQQRTAPHYSVVDVVGYLTSLFMTETKPLDNTCQYKFTRPV